MQKYHAREVNIFPPKILFCYDCLKSILNDTNVYLRLNLSDQVNIV